MPQNPTNSQLCCNPFIFLALASLTCFIVFIFIWSRQPYNFFSIFFKENAEERGQAAWIACIIIIMLLYLPLRVQFVRQTSITTITTTTTEPLDKTPHEAKQSCAISSGS